ncbi:MAG TPA: YciI family protein [Gaiellaceae bacterium]|nr:YciI family protein [Gaiellaceae bacterium]
MAKFMYLYRGTIPELTPEQGAEREAAFAAWIEKLGPALVDVGSPFVGTKASVGDDRSEGAAGELAGYSIVEADDLAQAKAFTDGLPFLSERDGKHTIEIYELLSI